MGPPWSFFAMSSCMYFIAVLKTSMAAAKASSLEGSRQNNRIPAGPCLEISTWATLSPPTLVLLSSSSFSWLQLAIQIPSRAASEEIRCANWMFHRSFLSVKWSDRASSFGGTIAVMAASKNKSMMHRNRVSSWLYVAEDLSWGQVGQSWLASLLGLDAHDSTMWATHSHPSTSSKKSHVVIIGSGLHEMLLVVRPCWQPIYSPWSGWQPIYSPWSGGIGDPDAAQEACQFKSLAVHVHRNSSHCSNQCMV